MIRGGIGRMRYRKNTVRSAADMRREVISCIIQQNPGIQFRDIMRRTGMKNGVLSHHLRKIEKTGTVMVERSPQKTHYYPLGTSELESRIAKALRRGTHRKIILSLLRNRDGLSFLDLIRGSSRAPSTISQYTQQLAEDGIVKIEIKGRKRWYRLMEREQIDRLVEKYRPGALDKPASGIEDIFNSL